jgi:hypothetical protein
VQQARRRSGTEQVHHPAVPDFALRMGRRLRTRAHEPAMKPKQFRSPRVVELLDPIREDEPTIIARRISGSSDQ